jgi:UrcA family protein
MHRRFINFAAALLSGLSLAAPAFAFDLIGQDRRAVEWFRDHQIVRYHDLDLAHPSDRARLLARVEHSITEGCRITERPATRGRCMQRVRRMTWERAPSRAREALLLAERERAFARFAQN